MYYNIYIAASTTTQGRSCIASSIMFFESFLSNNIKFGSLNEVVTFIYNIIGEERNYNDALILDEDITAEECFFKIMSTCGFEWMPTEKEMCIIWDIVTKLTCEDWNRLYYKNNLYSFCENKTIMNALVYILQKLEKPFLNPNKPPKEIAVELDELLAMLKEYVYYSHHYIDKMDRVDIMFRDVTLVTDTDSCIVSLDAWYRFLLNNTYKIPMNIKRHFDKPIKKLKVNRNDDDMVNPLFKYDKVYDYDFYDDKVVEMKRAVNPLKLIPQDSVRYSIINILAYCIGELVTDYMEKYTMNYNSYSKDKKCLLIMKNEFLFKRILLTDGMKNYAAKNEMQEGNMIPDSESMKITGLAIDKVGLQHKTRESLKKVLYEDILNKDNIDQIQVLKDIIIIEKNIYNSLVSGKKEYYKPASIKSLKTYENPMSIQGIKASIVYNTLRDDWMEAIDLESRNFIDIVKVIMTPRTIDKIKDKFPDKYNKIIELFSQKHFDTGITSVALPQNVDVPEWLLEFIDYKEIISNNVSNFPLECIGLYRLSNNNVNYSNILKL